MRQLAQLAIVVLPGLIISFPVLLSLGLIPSSWSEKLPDINIVKGTSNLDIAYRPIANFSNSHEHGLNKSLVTFEDTPVSFNVLRAYYDSSDPDIAPPTDSYQPMSYSVSSYPISGTLQVANSTQPYYLTYIPEPNFNGDDYFAITFIDGITQTRTISFSVLITPVEDPLIAKDYLFFTSKNEPLTIPPITDDTDVDRNEGITITSVSDPTYGKLKFDGGFIQYLPNHDFVGKDSFKYILSDTHGVSTQPATIAVEVVDSAAAGSFPYPYDNQESPSAGSYVTNDTIDESVAISNQNNQVFTSEDASIIINVLSYNPDDESQSLARISLIDLAVNGTAIVTEDGAAIRYTPGANFWGTDKFTYVISSGGNDEAELTSTVIVVVKPVNDAPIARGGQDQSAKTGMLVTLDGSSSIDPDGTITSYHWEQITNPDQPPIQLNILSDDLANPLTFTSPDVDEEITVGFKLIVTDNGGASSSDVVGIILQPMSNGGPTANAGEDLEVQEKELVTLDGSRSIDPDNNLLSYSWKQEGDDPLVMLQNLNSSNPSFTAPSVGKAGATISFTLRVVDQFGRADNDSIKVFVSNVNNPPIAISGQNQTVGEATYVRLDGTGSFDADKDKLTYSWQQISGPEVSISNPNSSQPSFKTPTSITGASQSLSFILRVSDGRLSATDTAEVIVQDTISPPQILKTAEFRKDVIREIDQAEKFVYVSMFYVEDYSTNGVLDALERATQRGIDVRVAFAQQNVELYPTIESNLAERGIPYKIVSNHAKIVVIDDEFVYVGSANLNKNGLVDNWELTIKTNNLDTVREAKQFINQAWKLGAKIEQSNHYEEENFANGSEYYDMLLESIENADTIRIIMYEATYDFKDSGSIDTQLLDTIKETYGRGADLELLLDNPRYYEAYGGKQFLTRNVIPHKVDDRSSGSLERLHAKAILIDDEILFIGSQNFNDDSLDSSSEAAIVTENPDTISYFLNLFNEKWNVGTYIVRPGNSTG